MKSYLNEWAKGLSELTDVAGYKIDWLQILVFLRMKTGADDNIMGEALTRILDRFPYLLGKVDVNKGNLNSFFYQAVYNKIMSVFRDFTSKSKRFDWGYIDGFSTLLKWDEEGSDYASVIYKVRAYIEAKYENHRWGESIVKLFDHLLNGDSLNSFKMTKLKKMSMYEELSKSVHGWCGI